MSTTKSSMYKQCPKCGLVCGIKAIRCAQCKHKFSKESMFPAPSPSNSQSNAPKKTCPECGAQVFISRKVCDCCNYTFVPKSSTAKKTAATPAPKENAISNKKFNLCPECGSQVISSATSCPECGFAFVSAPPPRAQHEEPQTPSTDNQDAPIKQLKKTCPYCGTKVFISHARCDACDYDFLSKQEDVREKIIIIKEPHQDVASQKDSETDPSDRCCGQCMYLDHKNTEGMIFTKYFCGEMHRYVGYNTKACAKYVQRHGCYLTSACVEQKGLPDDCYELTTLRAFRDQYISKLNDGQNLIDQYYATAPLIVSKINSLPNKDEIYDRLYEHIQKCIFEIEHQNFSTALNLYKDMVEKLKDKFL